MTLDRDNRSREETIRALYSGIVNQLPDTDDESSSFFDESTGTWYALTGRMQIDKLNIERAKTYFQNVVAKSKSAPVGTSEYERALFCAIAVEAIAKYLDEKKK